MNKTEVNEVTRRYFDKFMEIMQELEMDSKHAITEKKCKLFMQMAMDFIRTMRRVGVVSMTEAESAYERVEQWDQWTEDGYKEVKG